MLRNALATLVISALLAAGISIPANAADVQAVEAPASKQESSAPRFFVHVGPAGLVLDEDANIYAAGARVPGGTIKIKSHVTLAVEAGYFITPNFAVSFTGGLPPTVKIQAAGTMDGMGRVGVTTYGPMTLTMQYHFTGMGRFQPYVGAGPAVMHVFDETDGIMSKLRVENSAGFALQAGVDYMLTDNWGIFFDVKKAILRTNGTGYLGPAPIKADIKLDPLVVHSGVTFRF